jgi:putative transposase
MRDSWSRPISSSYRRRRRPLFVLVLLADDRRRIVHVAVTDHLTAAWTAQQFRDAFPGMSCLAIRDRDHAFNHVHTVGIQEVLTAPASPWQNSQTRTHLGLNKDAPISRPIAPPSAGSVIAIPQVGSLHHRYERRAA